MKRDLPPFYHFIQPIVASLQSLGGSASKMELSETVFFRMGLSDSQLNISHNETSGQSEADYRLSRAQMYLRKYGAIEFSPRGVWSLTKGFSWVQELDYRRVLQFVGSQDFSLRGYSLWKIRECGGQRGHLQMRQEATYELDSYSVEDPVLSWRDSLREILLSLSPSAFERLTMRILRECGFVQVEVTGKPGDRGIDGKGIVKLNHIMSFHMVFQCKRYRKPITPDMMRDFRGAMAGNADKGLFITTGMFTKEARAEANKPGTPPIDLIDGEELIDLLRQLELGLHPVVTYEVDASWFDNL